MAPLLASAAPPGLYDLRDRHPGLRARPSPLDVRRLEGDVHFEAVPPTGPVLEDTYQLRIDVPTSFPEDVPIVFEVGGRIPRNDPDAHVNPDGSLCLGAPIRLALIAKARPSVLAFFDQCVVPALYNAAYRERFGGRLPLGELAHGSVGELDDYVELFGVKTYRQAVEVLQLAGVKHRRANKLPCPCGCGRRLGVCRTNERVRFICKTLGRPQCRRLAAELVDRVHAEIEARKRLAS